MDIPAPDNIVEQIDGIRLSLSALSREFGIARETVGRRLARAGIAADGDRKGFPVYRLGPSCRALLAAEIAVTGKVDNPEDLPPLERRAWYQSERERVHLEKEQEHLVPAEEVREQLALVLKITSQLLDTLPDTLERDCRLQPDAVAIIEQRIDLVRSDWAEKLEA
jgi:hypothetical protein